MGIQINFRIKIHKMRTSVGIAIGKIFPSPRDRCP